MKAAELATQLHESGLNCAQSVLGVFAEAWGLPLAPALKLAAPFGGGMRMAATCGALTGALMALGLAYGYCEYEEHSKAKSDHMTRTLLQRWREEIGPTECKAILGYDVSDPEQRDLAIQASVFDLHCPQCIAKGAEIVAELLAELV